MKKSLLILIITLFLINFASAYYGSYGSLSLSSILDRIDPSTAILGALFFIFFIFLNFSLNKFLKNRIWAGIAAFAASFLIIYFLNKNYDVYNLLYGWGFSDSFLSIIIPLILIGILVFIGFSLGWGASIISLGVLLIIAGLTEMIYETVWAFFLGAVAMIIGIYIASKELKKKSKKRKLKKMFPWMD